MHIMNTHTHTFLFTHSHKIEIETNLILIRQSNILNVRQEQISCLRMVLMLQYIAEAHITSSLYYSCTIKLKA